MKILTTILLAALLSALMTCPVLAQTKSETYTIAIYLPDGSSSRMTADSVWHMRDTIGTLNAVVDFTTYKMKQYNDLINSLYRRIDSLQKRIDASKRDTTTNTSYLGTSVLKTMPDTKGWAVTQTDTLAIPIIDTTAVLAYCCTDYNKPTFKWLKMYGISGIDKPSISINGLMIYQAYLMKDRKTKAVIKPVFAIVRKLINHSLMKKLWKEKI